MAIDQLLFVVEVAKIMFPVRPVMVVVVYAPGWAKAVEVAVTNPGK